MYSLTVCEKEGKKGNLTEKKKKNGTGRLPHQHPSPVNRGRLAHKKKKEQGEDEVKPVR